MEKGFSVGRRSFLSTLLASAATMALKPRLALATEPQAASPLERTPETDGATEFLLTFGSCNFQWMPQTHWDRIGALKPDAWIWLGDTIYSDYLDPALRRWSYHMLQRNAHYKSFVESTRVLATWDDHDYGLNDSGKDLPGKEGNQQLFLDFLGYAENHPLRRQEGVYHSARIEKNGRAIHVILLDLRYFRETPGPTAGLLGESQWHWLEREIELAGRTSDLVLIGSSVQFLIQNGSSDDWSGFPAERERMKRLLATCAVPTLILSGDVHAAEILSEKAPDLRSGQGAFYEFTSSGLTHSDKKPAGIPAISPTCREKNFGVIGVRIDADRSVALSLEIRRIDGSVFHTLPVAFGTRSAEA